MKARCFQIVTVFIQKIKILNWVQCRAWGNRERLDLFHCLHFQDPGVGLDVLYLNPEPNFEGIGPPRGKNLNDKEHLEVALGLGKNLPRQNPVAVKLPSHLHHHHPSPSPSPLAWTIADVSQGVFLLPLSPNPS